MNVVIWIFQGVLAILFLMAGLMKVSKSKEEIKEQGGERMAWVDDISGGNIRLIGILEVLGVVGLLLPQLTGIYSWLTPYAAIGLALTMVGASLLHIQRKDGAKAIGMNIIIFLVAVFVAYGRFALVPA